LIQLKEGKFSSPKHHPSNRVTSQKYSLLTFLPITILLQLSKVLNIFYLVNGSLQTIPAISTVSPLASLIPVLFVIFVGIVLEAISEYRRYCSDYEQNSQPVK
jgi:hypothetical protein